MTLTLLLAYLLVLVFIALGSFKRVQSYSDFFVARKKGSYLAVTGSLVATILGGSAVIGAIDAGHRLGWATSWFMLSAALGLFLLLPLTKKISKLGRFTLPDLLEDLYDHRIKKVASYIIPLAWIGIVAAQIIASARILQSFVNIDYRLGVVLSAVIFVTYTIAGGQISILKTDFVQSVLIVLGLVTLTIFINRTGQEINPVRESFPFHNQFSPTDLLILIITYSSTFTAGPDIYSRIFCAKDEKTARKAVLTTAIILIPVAFVIGYLAIYGTHIPVAAKGSTIVEITQQVLPAAAIPLVVLALLSAVLSSADTTLLSASIIVTDLFEKSTFGNSTLKHSRIIILLLGTLSLVIALYFSSIIAMLLLALTIYSGAFILPIISGLAGIKVKSSFVSIAIIAGGAIAFVGKLVAMYVSPELGNWIILSAFITNGTLLFAGSRISKSKSSIN